MSGPNRKIRLLTYIVEEFSDKKKGKRIDRYLAERADFPSRSQLKDWFDQGLIRRSGQPLKPSDLVRSGDELEVQVPEPKQIRVEAREVPLQIFYEDEFLLVLIKPRGLSMHPGASFDDSTTLVHALLYHSQKLSNHSGLTRPGIVHRLDKDTEGLVVVAKNNEVHENLSEQFSNRQVDRAYWALVYGRFPEKMLIEAPIGRSPKDRKKMAVVSRGRPAKTEVTRLAHDGRISWVRCKLFTGRTHQIRVHLSFKGFPIVNDPTYARKKDIEWSPEERACLEGLQGQCLMAYQLGFTHPITKAKLFFEAEKPEWLQILTQKMT